MSYSWSYYVTFNHLFSFHLMIWDQQFKIKLESLCFPNQCSTFAPGIFAFQNMPIFPKPLKEDTFATFLNAVWTFLAQLRKKKLKKQKKTFSRMEKVGSFLTFSQSLALTKQACTWPTWLDPNPQHGMLTTSLDQQKTPMPGQLTWTKKCQMGPSLLPKMANLPVFEKTLKKSTFATFYYILGFSHLGEEANALKSQNIFRTEKKR